MVSLLFLFLNEVCLIEAHPLKRKYIPKKSDICNKSSNH